MTLIVASGVVEPKTGIVALTPLRTGKVTRIAVASGDRVKAGQILMQVDSEKELFAVESAKSTRNLALVALRHQTLLTQEARSRVETAAAHERVLEVTVDTARKEVDRNRELFQGGLIATREYEVSNGGLQIAIEQLRQARAESKEARAVYATSITTLASAALDLKQSGAAIRRAEQDVSDSELVSPTVGTVLSVNAHVGEVMVPEQGHPPITLADLRTLSVRVDIDEASVSEFDATCLAVAIYDARKQPLRLSFDRLDPVVVPKSDLSPTIEEKSDLRVLHVYYDVEPHQGVTLFSGQQLEVKISAEGCTHRR